MQSGAAGGGVEGRGGKSSNKLPWSLLQGGELGLGKKLVPSMGLGRGVSKAQAGGVA